MKKLNLQMFADEAVETEAVETPETTQTEQPDEKSKPAEDKKYTDADVDRILGKKFAEWEKKQEKKTSEAERLGRMTAEEKAAEKLKSLEDKIRGYEAAAARSEMTKQARAILQDKGINVSDALISNLIAEDADSTKEAVEGFVTLFKDAVDKAVKEAYKGETPKKGTAAPKMTVEQIMSITNRAERQKAIAENMELFPQQ